MPRGVYDRSKAKKKVAKAGAVEAAPKQKRAYTKRAKAPEAVPTLQGAAMVPDNDYAIISQLRELAQIRSLGITQVDGIIKKLVNKLEANFDGNNTKSAELAPEVKETKSNGKAAKASQELPSPVPFVVPSETAPNAS